MRLSRSSSSTWAKGGVKKKQRSTQWFFSQIAPSTLLHQFLKENGQTTDDFHAMLVTYFQNEEAFDAYESLYDFQVSRRYRLDIPSSPQEDWPLCGDTDRPPDVIESEDQFEEVVVEDLHLPTEDAVPGHPDGVSGPSVATVSCAPWQELTSTPLRKSAGRPPRIPQSRAPMLHPRIPQVNAIAPSINRDLTVLIASADARTTTEWQQVLDTTSPCDIPFAVFGVNAHICLEPASISSSGRPLRFEPSLSSVASSTWNQRLSLPPTQVANHWDDSEALVPDSGSDFGDPRPTALRAPFVWAPSRQPCVAFNIIYHMREPAFFYPDDGVLGGYRWAHGVTKASKGHKVRQRISRDGHWCRQPVEPFLSNWTTSPCPVSPYLRR